MSPGWVQRAVFLKLSFLIEFMKVEFQICCNLQSLKLKKSIPLMHIAKKFSVMLGLICNGVSF